MNVSLGTVEWEENRRSAPGTLGKKLAVALSVLTLAALALGNWFVAPELPSVGDSTAPVAEVAFAADPDLVRAGSPVFTK